jgi:subtilase family serine protease
VTSLGAPRLVAVWLAQFGPPSETESLLMDIAILGVLVAAIVTGVIAYRNRRR